MVAKFILVKFYPREKASISGCVWKVVVVVDIRRADVSLGRLVVELNTLLTINYNRQKEVAEEQATKQQ